MSLGNRDEWNLLTAFFLGADFFFGAVFLVAGWMFDANDKVKVK